MVWYAAHILGMGRMRYWGYWDEEDRMRAAEGEVTNDDVSLRASTT